MYIQKLSKEEIKKIHDLDGFEPGQIVVLKFYPMMDNDTTHFENCCKNPEKCEKIIKNAMSRGVNFPAIIISKNIRGSFPPATYDVALFQRYRTGEEKSAVLLH